MVGIRYWLDVQAEMLTPEANSRLTALVERYEPLQLISDYRKSLQNIWLKTAKSQQELIESLQNWCKQAENSGLEVLSLFALRLKGLFLNRTGINNETLLANRSME